MINKICKRTIDSVVEAQCDQESLVFAYSLLMRLSIFVEFSIFALIRSTRGK